MKKIKYLLPSLSLNFILGILPAQAQSADMGSGFNVVGLIVGGVFIAALIMVITMMVRHSGTTLGGIQDQDKTAPEPITTQSINNPGAGV